MKNLKFVLFLAVAAIFASCNASAPPPPAVFDMAAAKTAIEASNQKLAEAMSKGDAAGVASCYTKDAKFMTPNAPSFVGRAAIQTNSAAGIAAGATELKLDIIDLWGDGDMLVEEGVYSIGNKEGQTFDKGKYLILWKKEGGQWKMHRDMYNSDMPVPPPPPVD